MKLILIVAVVVVVLLAVGLVYMRYLATHSPSVVGDEYDNKMKQKVQNVEEENIN